VQALSRQALEKKCQLEDLKGLLYLFNKLEVFQFDALVYSEPPFTVLSVPESAVFLIKERIRNF
jgi:hypothetical protein